MEWSAIVEKISSLLKEWEEGLEREGLHYLPSWLLILVGVVLGGYVHQQWIEWKLRGSLFYRLKYWTFYWFYKLPFVRGIVAEKLAGAKVDIEKGVHGDDTDAGWKNQLPEEGLDKDVILEELTKYSSTIRDGADAVKKPDIHNGDVSGAVFNTESNLLEIELNKEIFGRTQFSNPLWPKIYPEIRRCEAEVVAMTRSLLHGGPSVCGTMTSGGSMSILQACVAYRNAGFKKGISWPEIILPKSAHAAFYKSAKLLNIKVVEIEVEDTEFVASPARIKRAITRSTCAIIASVPNYPYGTCDDVEAIAKVAKEAQVGCHVDACCGGFLIPFFEDEQPRFDFRIPGVTSISADTHKYGLSPKGSSVILYSSEELRGHAFYKDSEWCGGIYASPTVEGSRNGSAIAVTWSSLLFNGQRKLRESAATVRRVTRELRKKIESIEGMELLGRGDVCIVAWRHTEVDNYKLIDLVDADCKIVLSPVQFPTGAHLMVTPLHGQPGFVDRLIASLENGIRALKEKPSLKTTGTAALYGMTIDLSDRHMVAGIAETYLSMLYTFPRPASPAPPAVAVDAADADADAAAPAPAPENNEAEQALLQRDE